MKLNCNVEVNNRMHNLTNLSIRKKSQRGYLVIGRQSIKNDELYILLQTEQNKCGTKYKVIFFMYIYVYNVYFFLNVYLIIFR